MPRCATTAARFPPARVAADREPLRVAAKPFGVRVRPVGGSERVVERRGKRVLGREAVVDREHRVTARHRKTATGCVVRVEIADHPAAAVEVDEQADARVRSWPVQASRDAARVDPADFLDLDRRRLQPRPADGAGRLGRRLGKRRVAERVDVVEDCFRLLVEKHHVSVRSHLWSVESTIAAGSRPTSRSTGGSISLQIGSYSQTRSSGPSARSAS